MSTLRHRVFFAVLAGLLAQAAAAAVPTPTVSAERKLEAMGTAPRITSPVPEACTTKPSWPESACCTMALSRREKRASGISGFTATTSFSPVALNTSTTPRLYSVCFWRISSARSSSRSSRKSRPFVMRPAIWRP